MKEQQFTLFVLSIAVGLTICRVGVALYLYHPKRCQQHLKR